MHSGSTTTTGRALARLGLLGNPSDGFGGRVIATTIDEFSAVVTASAPDSSETWELVDANGAQMPFADVGEIAVALGELSDGAELLGAAIVSAASAGLANHLAPRRLTFSTDIPRQVGLAGSSAIITAALRALGLAGLAGADQAQLAHVALQAETHQLGWTAGPQDRVAQAHEGLLDMDFGRGWQPADWTRLDSGALPPLVLGWDPAPATSSDVVHRDVRALYDQGDPDVIAAMRQFGAFAQQGRLALDAGQAIERWPELFDQAFDLRAQFYDISTRDREMIYLARHQGCGAAFAGSGGAIVAVPRLGASSADLIQALESSGFRACVATPTPTPSPSGAPVNST